LATGTRVIDYRLVCAQSAFTLNILYRIIISYHILSINQSIRIRLNSRATSRLNRDEENTRTKM